MTILKEGRPQRPSGIMVDLFMAVIAAGMVVFIGWEIIQESRGGSSDLRDRYHE